MNVKMLMFVMPLWLACLSTGCTHPKQPNAMLAQQSGIAENRVVKGNLAGIAKRQALEIANLTPDKGAAVEKLNADLSEIHREEMQGEIAESSLQIATEFIASQRGAFDIYRSDWKKARAATSQPAN